MILPRQPVAWMRSLPLHDLCRPLRREQRAIDVDTKHTPPRIEWEVEKRRDVENAGVVDQDVQTLVGLGNALE